MNEKYSDIWVSPTEYFQFCKAHGVWGADAIRLRKKTTIPDPEPDLNDSLSRSSPVEAAKKVEPTPESLGEKYGV